MYDLLGVGPDVPWETIHKAYRKLRSECHPDRGGNEEAFMRVQAAYDILSDRAKRKAYDDGEVGPDGKPAYKTEEDEIRAVARQGLMQMLSQLLEIDKPIFTTLLQAIAKHDSDANLLILKLRRNRNKLEARMKNSIIFKGQSDDLLSVLAKQKIDAWEKQIIGCQRSLKIFAEGKKMALELQNKYEEVQPEGGISMTDLRMYEVNEGFNPDELARMMKEVFGAADHGAKANSKNQGTTIRTGYGSPYGPQRGKR